jgi:isopenicillin-N N-acyltransferase-like protein
MDIEHVDVRGTAFEMGLQHGRRLAELIPQVVGRETRFAGSPTALRAAIHSIEKTLLARCPNIVEEMQGIAEGAGVPYEKILELNVGYDAKGDMLHASSQCTAVGLPNTPEGPLVAKTDDVSIDERAFEVFFRAEPEEGHAFVCYAFGGSVSNHGGINQAGLALAMNGLPPAGGRDPDGIPSLIFLRQVLLCCATVEEALAFADANPLRGYGCTMTMADPSSGDITVVENYATVRAVLRSSSEPTVRTNHPHCAETVALPQDELWAAHYGISGLMSNSRARAENGARLVQEIPWSVDGLKQLLGNHAESGAICQHGQADLHTSIAMIMVPAQRAMIAAEGYGCESYVEYTV